MGVDKFIITKHEKLPDPYHFKKLFDGMDQSLKKHFEYRDHQQLILSNRGGTLTELTQDQTLELPCQIPQLIMTITVKGNVLPCFEDFHQTQQMGNVLETNLLDIWKSEKYKNFRDDLKNKKRKDYSICKNCNRVSSSMLDNKTERHLLGKQELDAIERVFKSGRLYRYQDGQSECELFEENFAKLLGVKKALLVNSGTNALIAALMCAGIGPGDEVIVPAYTFVASANAVLNVGAVPIIANIDERLGLSLEDLKLKINDKTKAIIAVHMDGRSCNIFEIAKFAKEKKLILIEDTAQALGAKINGTMLGSIGDFGCFSLNMDKVLTTGEGGIVVTNSEENYQKLLCLSDGGYPYGEFETRNLERISPFVGLSMRMSEITGAMANVQLTKLDDILNMHRERKEILESYLIKAKNFELMPSYDSSGDCGVKIHLFFNDNEVCQQLGKKFRDHNLLFYPPFLRRAHVAWKWMHYFGEKAEIDPRRNAYNLTEKKYKYHKMFLLPSIEIITKTLILDINVNFSLEQMARMGELVLELDRELG